MSASPSGWRVWCSLTSSLAGKLNCSETHQVTIEPLTSISQPLSYEPELFPGLIYRMVKPRIVLLIFVSGKVVLTGAKERGEIYEAFERSEEHTSELQSR